MIDAKCKISTCLSALMKTTTCSPAFSFAAHLKPGKMGGSGDASSILFMWTVDT